MDAQENAGTVWVTMTQDEATKVLHYLYDEISTANPWEVSALMLVIAEALKVDLDGPEFN